MGWFIWLSYLTEPSITWHLHVYETQVSEWIGYCPLHPQIFLLGSVSQQTGLYVLLHSFLFCFSPVYLLQPIRGTSRRSESARKKEVDVFFLPHSLPCCNFGSDYIPPPTDPPRRSLFLQSSSSH